MQGEEFSRTVSTVLASTVTAGITLAAYATTFGTDGGFIRTALAFTVPPLILTAMLAESCMRRRIER